MANAHYTAVMVGILGLSVLPHPAAANVTLFNDNFSTFTLGSTWSATPGLLGAPNVVLAPTGSGLRMVTAQAPGAAHGINTNASFSLTTGTVQFSFTTGQQVDNSLTLPAGTDRENIDGLLEVGLQDYATGAILWTTVWGGCYGTCTEFTTLTAAGQVWATASGAWTYGTSYSVVYLIGLNSTTEEILNSGGIVLYSTTIAEGSVQLGSFGLILYQAMGSPSTSYYNDATVNDIDITAAPEAPAWSMLVGGLAAVPVLRRRRAG